ncbi:MAG: hypothetical protein LBG88_00665 [Christensenellaceae bacterium]|jgi:hypothetical protein|nr:hypothetical protein [Christensenellaceae bacterium]
MAKTTWTYVFNFVAFLALAFIGFALLLAKIVPSISGPLMAIAIVLAYIMIIFYSGLYVFRDGKRRWATRNFVECVIWVVATILVVVFLILNKDFTRLF